MRLVGNKMWENQMMVIPAAICSVSFTHLSKTNWAEPIPIADELAAVMDDRAWSTLGCQMDPQVQADGKSEHQSGKVNPKLKESSVPNFWGQACSTWGENCCHWDGKDRLMEKAIMLLLRCHCISLLHNLSLANLNDKRWSGLLRGVGYAAGTHFLVGIPATCNYPVRDGLPLLPRSGLYKTYRSLAGVFEHYTLG